jgi:hypothetical protein
MWHAFSQSAAACRSSVKVEKHRTGCGSRSPGTAFLTFLTRATRALCYKGDRGFQRYVGWCVITKNLFSIARYQQRRRDHDQVS